MPSFSLELDDAGAGWGADPGGSFLPRLLRCQDVIGNQALAVRKRWLVASFEDGLYRGAYWGIGTEIEGYPQHGQGYSGIVLDRLRAVRTDLDAFSEEEQLVLINHGWVLADAAPLASCLRPAKARATREPSIGRTARRAGGGPGACGE